MYRFQFAKLIPFNDNLILSLKSMWICSHIRTQLLDILGVDSFHVETVCLLSKLSEAKNHISVKVDMDEMDVTAAESRSPETPEEKEEAIIEAFKAFQMIKP